MPILLGPQSIQPFSMISFLSELELNKLGSTIEKRNPLYYQSLFDTSSITIENMSKVLSASGQALLELFDGDSSVYALVITAGKTYLQRVNKKAFDSLSVILRVRLQC